MHATTTTNHGATIALDPPAAEAPLADRYAAQLDHLVKQLAPVLDYHKSLEMSAFSRGDQRGEDLHRDFVGKLSEVFHHLEANRDAARIIANTGGAQ